MFARNLAIFARVPTLYLSADTDEWTVRQGVAATITGYQLEKIEQDITSEDDDEARMFEKWYAGQLRQADHIDWCFRSDIDVEFIANRVAAYAELRGEYPVLIVVDNLRNVVEDMEAQYSELEGICRELQSLARTTKAHVMALHHVVGDKEDGREQIGMRDLLGKIGKIPEQVLGLSWDSPESVLVNIPKNRGGKRGQIHGLGMDYSRQTVSGYLRGSNVTAAA